MILVPQAFNEVLRKFCDTMSRRLMSMIWVAVAVSLMRAAWRWIILAELIVFDLMFKRFRTRKTLNKGDDSIK